MLFRRKPSTGPQVTPRSLLVALGLAATGSAGLLPVGALDPASPSPLALLGWFALSAPAVGFLAGAQRLALWPLGLVPPAVWMVLLGLLDATSPVGLATPAYAGMVWTGLYAAGYGVGRRGLGAPFAGAAWLVVVALGLTLLPTLELDLPAWWIARAVDLSPVTLLMESAGVDWMRHPAIYDRAGDLPPTVRVPYRGILAGPLVLLVGCSIAILSALRRRDLTPRGDLPDAAA